MKFAPIPASRFGNTRVNLRSCFILIPAAILFAGVNSASACPLCGPPQITLSERFAQSDAALLVEWISANNADGDKAAKTVFKVKEVAKDSQKSYQPGDQVVTDSYTTGNEGDLFLLMGKQSDDKLPEWTKRLPISEISYQFVVQAPTPETPAGRRLKFYIRFLEFPDPLIANDAFYEFVNAPYEDLVTVRDALPRDKLRKWLQDESTPRTRFGLYGLMLGLCGNNEDAEWLQDKIVESEDQFRLGVEGMIGGYLLLTGKEGVTFIQRHRLEQESVSDGEAYAVMQALRFLWQYEKGHVEPELLKQAMRKLLDRPSMTELVVRDLARWKDWAIQDRVMQIFAEKEYQYPQMQRAIVGYIIASTRDLPDDAKAETPEHVVKGKKYLAELEKSVPDIVRQVERLFRVPSAQDETSQHDCRQWRWFLHC